MCWRVSRSFNNIFLLIFGIWKVYDLDGWCFRETIECEHFSKYVDLTIAFLHLRTETTMVVVHFAKINTFRGTYTIVVLWVFVLFFSCYYYYQVVDLLCEDHMLYICYCLGKLFCKMCCSFKTPLNFIGWVFLLIEVVLIIEWFWLWSLWIISWFAI